MSYRGLKWKIIYLFLGPLETPQIYTLMDYARIMKFIGAKKTSVVVVMEKHPQPLH
jgi:hypothetical protein